MPVGASGGRDDEADPRRVESATIDVLKHLLLPCRICSRAEEWTPIGCRIERRGTRYSTVPPIASRQARAPGFRGSDQRVGLSGTLNRRSVGFAVVSPPYAARALRAGGEGEREAGPAFAVEVEALPRSPRRDGRKRRGRGYGRNVLRDGDARVGRIRSALAHVDGRCPSSSDRLQLPPT